ncbi:DUF2490 domain-containing protein [Legionella dresdenensis]|uniref:DUF2490 domain-containing protein n=1 Tax=Legionella dresdenensis TaxID=450200 RepID=A0ABV8CB48_9GAMM
MKFQKLLISIVVLISFLPCSQLSSANSSLLDDVNRSYIHPYKATYSNAIFNPFLVNAGLGYQFTPKADCANAQSLIRTAKHEARLWQQLIYAAPPKPLTATMHSQLEERKRQNSLWGYRVRNRLTISKSVTDSISLVSFDELSINLNQPNWVMTKVFEQNRLFLGLNQQTSDTLVVGAGYIYQLIFAKPKQGANVLALSARLNFM